MGDGAVMRTLPSLRQVWFQLHWLVGITAGTLLMVTGLTGGILAFREELLDALTPHVLKVPVRSQPTLSPDALLRAAQVTHPQNQIVSLTLVAQPGASARVGLAPTSGERRGNIVYVDPYTGTILPPLRGDAAFDWVESLHRWLLLPREAGRATVGTLALCLFGLAMSGLYLRWPKRLGDWRVWFTFNSRLKGRSFLWGLHSVAGTWALLAYVIFTTTGAYWSFDIVRDTVDGWADVRRVPRTAAANVGKKTLSKGRAASPKELPVLAPAWSTFIAHAPYWETATVRIPERVGQTMQITWLAADAPHVRARNRMVLGTDGALLKDEPYASMSTGQRALSTIYPLHMGSYFGLAGRIVMLLASLALPGFAFTGWLLYLKRRQQHRYLARERALLAQAAPTPGVAGGATVLIAFATQSGQAERIALHTASALRRVGKIVQVQALTNLAIDELKTFRTALFVVSSFGEGEPPDSARRFNCELQATTVSLSGLRFAVLGLGDRNYGQFCGFGHVLNHRLHLLGAKPLFPLIEVDQGDATAVSTWVRALGAEPDGQLEQSAFGNWPLRNRFELNAASLGSPLFEITLNAAPGTTWQAGDLVEVMPRHAASTVVAYLTTSALCGNIIVDWRGGRCALTDALALSNLPNPQHRFTSEQACADLLEPVTPRRYSIASLPEDGEVQLLVRQQRHVGGMGLASGWLTEHAAIGTPIHARIVVNPTFHGPTDEVPCIYIGNGSGMAGLRAHLRARVRAGHARNWLLLGERQREFDNFCAQEIAHWREQGLLPELDLVFSRDAGGARYVQDRLCERSWVLREWVARGAVIHVCGSRQGMATGVDSALTKILGPDLCEQLMATGRYRRDIY